MCLKFEKRLDARVNQESLRNDKFSQIDILFTETLRIRAVSLSGFAGAQTLRYISSVTGFISIDNPGNILRKTKVRVTQTPYPRKNWLATTDFGKPVTSVNKITRHKNICGTHF